MITFQLAFRGFEIDLDDFAGLLQSTLHMDFDAAFALAEDAMDVDQIVVLQTTDAAFGQLSAEVLEWETAFPEDDGLVEIEVLHHQEPDPVVLSIHIAEAGL